MEYIATFQIAHAVWTTLVIDSSLPDNEVESALNTYAKSLGLTYLYKEPKS